MTTYTMAIMDEDGLLFETDVATPVDSPMSTAMPANVRARLEAAYRARWSVHGGALGMSMPLGETVTLETRPHVYERSGRIEMWVQRRGPDGVQRDDDGSRRRMSFVIRCDHRVNCS